MNNGTYGRIKGNLIAYHNGGYKAVQLKHWLLALNIDVKEQNDTLALFITGTNKVLIGPTGVVWSKRDALHLAVRMSTTVVKTWGIVKQINRAKARSHRQMHKDRVLTALRTF